MYPSHKGMYKKDKKGMKYAMGMSYDMYDNKPKEDASKGKFRSGAPSYKGMKSMKKY